METSITHTSTNTITNTTSNMGMSMGMDTTMRDDTQTGLPTATRQWECAGTR